ncbi:MAG: hypothetical protein A2284_09785 [Deltaproteobacteria bacterium RIFOXYA12_FULL_61_11]|nr:MAG: hypothetical protein A2284_09785 [Deltaproteobacteria bacterium RIFOXYA12_FULL_61_11]
MQENETNPQGIVVKDAATLRRLLAEMAQEERAVEEAVDEEEVEEGFEPLVDVKETATAYEVFAELPGMTKKQLCVEHCEGLLVLTGEKCPEELAEGESYALIERAFGPFRRELQLPPDVEVEKIEAHFKNGLLHLILPRSERTRPRTIEIN